MAKAKVENKKLISIIGLPRQGTTLISGIFNSFENSFCSIEPHWAKLANKGQRMNSGEKVPDDFMYRLHPSDFVGEIKKFLLDSRMEIGSIKETYRSHEKQCCEFLLGNQEIDGYLFIFREPKAGFNAWRKVRWGGFYDNVDNYITSYLDLWNEFEKLKNLGRPTAVITYEKICGQDPSGYLSDKLKPFSIEFPSLDSIGRIGSYFGDPSASAGGKIRKSNNDYPLVRPDEIVKLRRLKEEIYDLI